MKPPLVEPMTPSEEYNLIQRRATTEEKLEWALKKIDELIAAVNELHERSEIGSRDGSPVCTWDKEEHGECLCHSIVTPKAESPCPRCANREGCQHHGGNAGRKPPMLLKVDMNRESPEIPPPPKIWKGT